MKSLYIFLFVVIGLANSSEGLSQVYFDVSTNVTSPFLEGSVGGTVELGGQEYSVLFGANYMLDSSIPNLADFANEYYYRNDYDLEGTVTYQLGLRYYARYFHGMDEVFSELKFKFSQHKYDLRMGGYLNGGFKYVLNSNIYTESFMGIGITNTDYEATSFTFLQFGFKVGYRLLGKKRQFHNTSNSKKNSVNTSRHSY